MSKQSFDPVLHSNLWSIVKNVSRYADSEAENQAIDELKKLITADRKRVELEARINELENHGNWANERAWRNQRIAELKAQQEEV